MKQKPYSYYNLSKKGLIEAYKKVGLVYLIKKLFSYFSDTLITNFLFLKKKRYFNFENKQLRYFYHKYNKTWKNERAIEVPIFLDFIKANNQKNILEIGNVMNHYSKFKHPVLDKYEKAQEVINQDLLDFKPTTKYNLIFSISTFEHIGIHDYPEEPKKAVDAIRYVLKNILNKEGKFILSFPINYNSSLNELITRNKMVNYKISYFKKVDISKNIWIQSNPDSIKFDKDIPALSGLVVLELNANTQIK